MAALSRWPANGDGRAVKATTEKITRRLEGPPRIQDLDFSLRELAEAAQDFRSILLNPFFDTALKAALVLSEGSYSPLGNLVSAAVEEVERSIAAYRSAEPPTISSLQEAQRFIPDQKTGPVKFEIHEGILRVQHQAALPPEADARNTEAALRELLQTGEQLITVLTASNMDRPLIDTIDDIKERLAAKQDIIQLGIAAIACQMVCAGYEQELSPANAAKVKAFAVSVGMYVSQFPEWVRYSENAATAEYSPNDVRALHKNGQELVQKLKGVRAGVDPEVPRTLAFLLETIRDPRRALKRTVFASIRAIENLVIVVFRGCGTAVSGISEGAREGLKTSTKVIAASALLLIAAQAAVAIAPAAGRVLQSNWLQEAGKLILDGLKTPG